MKSSRKLREFPHFGLENRRDVCVIPPADPFPGDYRVGVDDAAAAAAAILAVVVAACASACHAALCCEVVATTIPVVDAGDALAVI